MESCDLCVIPDYAGLILTMTICSLKLTHGYDGKKTNSKLTHGYDGKKTNSMLTHGYDGKKTITLY